MSRVLWRGAVALAVVAVLGAGVAGPAVAAEPTPPARDVTAFACPPGAVPASGFTDTAGLFTAEVDCLAWYAITTGGPAGLPADQYGPTLPVARGQMASFLARFLDHLGPTVLPAYDGQNAFDDVADDDTHVAAINRLADVGVVSGGVGGAPATTFAPGQAVSRDQMARFIAQTLGYLLDADLCVDVRDYFDDDAGNVHEPCINGLADIAVVAGVVPATYGPVTPVSRAQMSAFLMRAMDLLVEHELTATP